MLKLNEIKKKEILIKILLFLLFFSFNLFAENICSDTRSIGYEYIDYSITQKKAGYSFNQIYDSVQFYYDFRQGIVNQIVETSFYEGRGNAEKYVNSVYYKCLLNHNIKP